MFALHLDSVSETGNLETSLNLIQMVNTFHRLSSIFELMFMAVQVNGIRVKALVDMRAMHSCVASNVTTNLGLTIEAYDSIVTSLNGRNH